MPTTNQSFWPHPGPSLARWVCAVTLLAGAVPAGAVTWTVTDLSDSEAGSLRDAIASAAMGDTITFQSGLSGTIVLQNTLVICPGAGTGPTLTINGPGASDLAISGNHRVQVMNICQGANVAISDLTIENGSTIFGGGGIFNQGTLTVSNSTLSGNSGGGILNGGGTLTVTNSTLSGNSAVESGIFFGGGIFNDGGTLTVINSTLSGNSADSGGGIFNQGTLALTNSTLSGNSAAYGGGGIFNFGGTPTVTNSTLSGNSAPVGGGIFNFGGTLTVTNSTLSANSAPYVSSLQHLQGLGGGIANDANSTLRVTNSTFSGNSASGDQDFPVPGGGIANGGTATLKSTILAGNTGGNCFAPSPTSSAGYNLSDDGSCGFTATGDQNNVASIGLDLNGLRNNGGPTQTIALLPTSVAVDAIPVSACTDTNGNPVATDQRGISRPQGAGCDIGAFEYVESVPLTFSTSSKLQISGGTSPGFDLNATFTLDPTSNGLNPLTEAVMLQVGTYTVTLPAGSFKALKRGSKQNGYVYEGTIQGVALQLQIVPLSGGAYTLKAEGSPVDLTTLQNPVSVALTIADDAGSTQVYASF